MRYPLGIFLRSFFLRVVFFCALAIYFFLLPKTERRGPLRVRALVRVRCPFTAGPGGV